MVFPPEAVANDAVHRGPVLSKNIFSSSARLAASYSADMPVVCRTASENGVDKCELMQGSFKCVCPDRYSANVEVIGGKEVIVGQCQGIDE
eukprot:gene21386-25711_t